MDKKLYQRIRDIFHQVCELQPNEQAQKLNDLCRDNAELREEVERLLTAINIAEDTQFDPESFQDEQFMPMIEGFTIIRLLGEGGMGSVYEAAQSQPARRVAIKVLRLGYASKALTRRFQLEAQVLARLKHPGIAQIYEVGLDQQARQPYIVMELVEGPNLRDFISEHQPSVTEKLKIASMLCDAIDHAHQRGVVHRDLKPGNILIDELGVPKILDFGIARVTQQDVRAVTMSTEVGQIIGTLAYMSPEQASGDPSQIDVRSDVYSLGVIIFEMLTGRLPHDTEKMQLADALSVIREHEPTRVRSLDTRLRGDVDTIIAKALDRDPQRRYQSAAELGNDIRRHLANEPILARPPSMMYQLEKFARRNTGFVASVCVVFVLLTVGVLALSIALQRESAARREAEETLVRSNAAYDFLDDIFLGLDPKQTQGKDTELLRLMLERAAERAQSGIDIPVVRAEMLTLIGQTYNAVFAYEDAVSVVKDAIKLLESTTPLEEEKLHQAHSVLAASYYKLGQYDLAEEQYAVLVEYERRADDPVQLSITLRQFSEMIMETGRFNEAFLYIDEAASINTDHDPLEQARQQQQMGAVLRRLRRYDEAEVWYQRALDSFQQVGAGLETSIALNSLAIIARVRGKLEDAERYYTQSIALRERLDTRVNPDVAACYSNLGRLYNQMERYGDAIRVLQVSIDQHLDLFGKSHPNIIYPRVSFAQALSHVGRAEDALIQIQLASDLAARVLPKGHPLRVLVLTEYGHVYRARGEHQEAIEMYERALLTMHTDGPEDLAYAYPIWDGYTDSVMQLGDAQQEEKVLKQALSIFPNEDSRRDVFMRRLMELEEEIGE